MNQEQETRLVLALEGMAKSLALWCKLQQDRLDKEFPVKPHAREATVTHLPTDEETLILEQQGDDDWGQRERDFLATTRNKKG